MYIKPIQNSINLSNNINNDLDTVKENIAQLQKEIVQLKETNGSNVLSSLASIVAYDVSVEPNVIKLSSGFYTLDKYVDCLVIRFIAKKDMVAQSLQLNNLPVIAIDSSIAFSLKTGEYVTLRYVASKNSFVVDGINQEAFNFFDSANHIDLNKIVNNVYFGVSNVLLLNNFVSLNTGEIVAFIKVVRLNDHQIIQQVYHYDSQSVPVYYTRYTVNNGKAWKEWKKSNVSNIELLIAHLNEPFVPTDIDRSLVIVDTKEIKDSKSKYRLEKDTGVENNISEDLNVDIDLSDTINFSQMDLYYDALEDNLYKDNIIVENNESEYMTNFSTPSKKRLKPSMKVDSSKGRASYKNLKPSRFEKNNSGGVSHEYSLNSTKINKYPIPPHFTGEHAVAEIESFFNQGPVQLDKSRKRNNLSSRRNTVVVRDNSEIKDHSRAFSYSVDHGSQEFGKDKIAKNRVTFRKSSTASRLSKKPNNLQKSTGNSDIKSSLTPLFLASKNNGRFNLPAIKQVDNLENRSNRFGFKTDQSKQDNRLSATPMGGGFRSPVSGGESSSRNSSNRFGFKTDQSKQDNRLSATPMGGGFRSPVSGGESSSRNSSNRFGFKTDQSKQDNRLSATPMGGGFRSPVSGGESSSRNSSNRFGFKTDQSKQDNRLSATPMGGGFRSPVSGGESSSRNSSNRFGFKTDQSKQDNRLSATPMGGGFRSPVSGGESSSRNSSNRFGFKTDQSKQDNRLSATPMGGGFRSPVSGGESSSRNSSNRFGFKTDQSKQDNRLSATPMGGGFRSPVSGGESSSRNSSNRFGFKTDQSKQDNRLSATPMGGGFRSPVSGGESSSRNSSNRFGFKTDQSKQDNRLSATPMSGGSIRSNLVDSISQRLSTRSLSGNSNSERPSINYFVEKTTLQSGERPTILNR